jgi:NAD(P)-dependent dehydrogenase (short-subunit alcohol dehydrogenase family)
VNHAARDAIRFDGRVAVVTGGSRGIGRAHSLLLAERGAAVVVGGRDEATGEVAAEIARAGGRAVACVADLTDDAGGAALVAAAVDAFGRLDIVVGNAGSMVRTSVVETETAPLRAQLELDVVGPARLLRSAWPHLAASGAGRIVLTSSSGAFGSATALPYAAGKSAVIGLVRTLAISGEASGIKANAVAPFGFSRMTLANPYLTRAQVESRARLARPELVAAGVAALVHETCPVSGELFAIGAGRITRVFLVETRGHLDVDLTPESVAANWGAILDTDESAPVGFDHVKRFYAGVPGWGEV